MSSVNLNLSSSPIRLCTRIFILALGISSCVISKTIDEAQIDRSFSTNQPCEAPCWYGLEVGKKTSNVELMETLQHLPFVQTDTVKIGPFVQYECPTHFDDHCGQITIGNDGTILEIRFNVAYNLTIGEVVDKLGVPDYFVYNAPHPEVAIGCIVLLHWVNKRIAVSYFSKTWDQPCHDLSEGQKIPRDLQVTEIVYSGKRDFKPDCCMPWPGLDK